MGIRSHGALLINKTLESGVEITNQDQDQDQILSSDPDPEVFSKLSDMAHNRRAISGSLSPGNYKTKEIILFFCQDKWNEKDLFKTLGMELYTPHSLARGNSLRVTSRIF